MTDNLELDDRKWEFLNGDGFKDYACCNVGKKAGLKSAPLKRQFKTVKEILTRFQQGRGVLLADDVGLGKTTVGALVAWVIACQGGRVRIYAPNEVLRRRWAEELERHVPMLSKLGAMKKLIRHGDVGKLTASQIQVTTHYALVISHRKRTSCDLMIIDEAHRAKGDGSAFNKAINNLGARAKRKLILTATPFSIRLAELEQLLQFVGATRFNAIKQYAKELKGLYELGEGHDIAAESRRLVSSAKAAIIELQPYFIRHGINDLSPAEQKHFGSVSAESWHINTTHASEEEIKLLLRMDRLLQLTQERKGKRRNDPRFHIGWLHLGTELAHLEKRTPGDADPVVLRHIKAANILLDAQRKEAHPKIKAVSEAIKQILDGDEKVLVFCHHRATAAELLGTLEQFLKIESVSRSVPPEKVWREAWGAMLAIGRIWPTKNDQPTRSNELIKPIIDWLCSPGICYQITKWLCNPAADAKSLVKQLENSKPRKVNFKNVPTIAEAARTLVKSLLDEQSKSTRALLKNMQMRSGVARESHFPGRLDEGLRVMGSWEDDGLGKAPQTLYTGKPDVVLALFNSPFGPDVLVVTDRLSEGVDLHRCCRHLIHYELDPSPVRTIQRNGRIRRVGSWAALTEKPICYAYPSFDGTRDERAVGVMRQRINAFGLLLGGVPTLHSDDVESDQNFVEAVLHGAHKSLEKLNRKLGV